MIRTRPVAILALAAALAASLTACDRKKPQPDRAQQELERRQGDLMQQMDKIAAEKPPATPPAAAPSTETPPAPPAETQPPAAPPQPAPSDPPTPPPPG